MSRRVLDPDPALCAAGIRKGERWNRRTEQCANKRREGSEWCGVHDPGGTGVLVYGACPGPAWVDIESSEVLKDGPKTLRLKDRLRAYEHRTTIDRAEAAFSPLEALGNLVRAEEAKRDEAARVLALIETRVAQARAAYALHESGGEA